MTANSVPRWSITEKDTEVSELTPVKYCHSERCPEEETGKNSVSPCRIP